MPVERNTPQLVKKGKGKKRPGYAGWNPGAGSPGTTKSGGNKNTGSTGRERGADRNRNQRTTKSRTPTTGPTNIHTDNPNTPAPYTFIGGKKYNVTPETKAERNRAELKQQLMRQPLGGNRIDKFGNTKKNLFRGGGGGIGSLLASLFGMAMGIPGLGLLTGGFGKLKKGLGSLGDTLGDFREKFTGFKTQEEYDQAMIDRRQQKRLDKLFEAKDRGYNQIGFGDFTKKTMDFTPGQQAKIDDLLAQGYTPSTARNVLTGRDLKGFTESRGLQTPQTFSNPFRNTVGTTTKVNAPANDAVSSYSYGTAGASIPNPNLAPTPVENVIQDAYSGIKSIGAKGNSFLDSLYNADLINQLGTKAFQAYPSDSATGPLSDARHMAAMNELSKSLSPMNNKFGNFIGDTLAIGAGAINEIPDAFRGFSFKEGFDPKAIAAAKEDLSANYAGTYGTPNQTTAEQIYGDVFGNEFFEGRTPVQTASKPTYGTAAAEDITIDGGMLNSPFMETQIQPRIIAAENAYYNQGKMPSPFLADKIRMNMELGNARGFMGPGFADGGLASMFTRRG